MSLQTSQPPLSLPLQLVAELRTEYARAVSSCAGRLSATLRQQPATNLKSALFQPEEAGGQARNQATQQQVRQQRNATHSGPLPRIT
jgi:hypothetical protein